MIRDIQDVPLETRNTAFKGAWLKGYRAYYGGSKKSDNPYQTPLDRDKFYGAFHRHWNQGFEYAREHESHGRSKR